MLFPLAVRVAGENTAATPAGNPLTASETAELNPVSVAAMVSDAELLFATVKELALEVIPSEGTATISETVAVCFVEPLVPVMINVTLPAVAFEAAVSFSVLAPVPLTLAGVNAAVTPVGRPATVNATAELNPFCPVIERLTDPELPAVSVSELVVDATAKVGVGTTTAITCVAVKPPPVAVTVTL